MRESISICLLYTSIRKIQYERIGILKPVTILNGKMSSRYKEEFREIYEDQLKAAGTVLISKMCIRDRERERLEKEEEKLKKEIQRAQGMLSNEKFVSKAPQAKVEEERGKLEKYTQMLTQVQERMAGLKKMCIRDSLYIYRTC